MRMLLKYSLITLMVLSAIARSARAEDLVIQDSNGVTRGTSSVDGLGRVDFAVVDSAGKPAEGAVVTLTNSVTGETLTATSTLGGVSFENVSAGIWTVTSATPGLTFTSVTVLAIAGGGGAGLIAGSTVLGVVGAGGAATAVGIGISNATDGGSTDQELSPSS